MEFTLNGGAINPQVLEGQAQDGVHMGLGLALTEELTLDGGVPRSALRAFDGRWRTRLPMRDSAAAPAALPRLARSRT